ncbi:MAG: hypothetical protein KBT11_05995 [Treponema sp.]|nr:hypothetical protein [Candidatus Treponema equifaecale]
MLKKLSLVLAALLVGTMAFAQATADGGAAPAAAGSVNATWEWAKAPKSKIGGDYMFFKKQVVLEPVAGSKGAVFALENGEAKFKTEAYTAIYHNNKDATRLETLVNPKMRKAEYSITIDDAATIVVTVAGNGSKSKSRCVAIGKSGATPEEDAIIVGIDELSQDEAPVTITYANAPAGTYKVWGNGHRIVKVEAKN